MKFVWLVLIFSGLCYGQLLPPEKKKETGAKDSPGMVLKTKDPVTGELVETSDYQIESIKERDRRFIPDYREDREARFDGIDLVDQQGQSFSMPEGKVLLIEYWNTRGLDRNQFWKQARALEEKYRGSEHFAVVSINYDSSFDRIEDSGKVLGALAKAGIGQPELLVYDLKDHFRDRFATRGGSFYLLVDYRRQATHSGRGEVNTTQTVFDQVENAIKNIVADGYIPYQKAKQVSEDQ
jgi:hypothetical protein